MMFKHFVEKAFPDDVPVWKEFGYDNYDYSSKYQAEMIQDESLWLRALTARNNVAHSYNEAIALGIIKDSKASFIAMFEALETELLANWVMIS